MTDIRIDNLYESIRSSIYKVYIDIKWEHDQQQPWRTNAMENHKDYQAQLGN